MPDNSPDCASAPTLAFAARVGTAAGFELTSLREIVARTDGTPANPFRPHRLSFCSLMYIQSGSGTHQLDGQAYSLSAGDALFTGVAQLQEYVPDTASQCETLLLLFTEEFVYRAAPLPASVLQNLLFPLSDATPLLKGNPALAKSMELLELEWSQPDSTANAHANQREPGTPASAERVAALRSLLDYILLQIFRQRQSATPDGHPVDGSPGQSRNQSHLFQAFFALVREHFADTRNAVDYADRLGISYKHLNESCRQSSGLTAKEAIDRFVIIEARRRLATSAASLESIAIDLGFGEATNFTRYFKRATGETPAQFRRVRD